MSDQITLLAKIRSVTYRNTGKVEVEPQADIQLHRLTDMARTNGYTVVARDITVDDYPPCFIVTTPLEHSGGRHPYLLALVNETEVDSLRAEIQRLREECQQLREKSQRLSAQLYRAREHLDAALVALESPQ